MNWFGHYSIKLASGQILNKLALFQRLHRCFFCCYNGSMSETPLGGNNLREFAAALRLSREKGVGAATFRRLIEEHGLPSVALLFWRKLLRSGHCPGQISSRKSATADKIEKTCRMLKAGKFHGWFYSQPISRDGFKNIAFVNLSISPDALKAVSVAVDDLNTLRDFRAIDPMPLWTFSRNEALDTAINNLGLEPGNEVHADVKETSALLHLAPELVNEELARLPSCSVNPAWEVLKGNFSFQEMGSRDGYLGTPSLANLELGKLYVAEAAYALAESIKFAAEGNAMPELPLQIRMLLKMVDLDEM